MGTQVQSKTYSPEYYSTRDIAEDADSSWSMCYEDTTLSNHLYNGFSLKSLNGYSEYDKEMLKRTMVAHETTFRRQVYDLHRLYRIQKDLMDESHKKVLSMDSVQANSIQLNSFSSQMPRLPVLSTSYHTTSTTYTDNMNPPFNFFKESSKFPIDNGTLKDSYKYERMFNLPLPADVYIHSENTDRKDRCADLNRIYSVVPMNDVKLTLGTGEYLSGQAEICRSDRVEQNGPAAHCLADLNMSVEQFLRPKAHHEVQGNNLSMSFKSGEASCSNFPFAAEETRQDWPFHKTGAGERGGFLGSGLHNDNIPMTCEPIQLNPTKTRETLSSNNADTWVGKRRAFGNEISGRTSYLAISNNSRPSAPGTPGLLSFSTHLNNTHTATPLVSASAVSAEPVNILQALPIVNVQSKRYNTTVQASWSACDSLQHNGDSRTNQPRHGNEASFVNGYHNQFQAGCSSASIAKLSLDNRTDITPFWNDENHEPQKRLKGLQCTNMKLANDTYLNQAPPSRSQDGLIAQQDALFNSQIENISQRTEVSETPSCKKYFCFPILEKSHQKPACLPSNRERSITDDNKSRQKDSLSCTGLFSYIKATSVEKQIHAHINLNSTPEGELEAPSRITTQSVPEKVPSEVDLEAPIASHSEENVTSLREYVSPSKTDDSHDSECSDEALTRETAANIVQMSLENGSSFNGITYVSQSPALNTLQWFADVILSNHVDTTTSSKQCWSEGSDGGLDHFELMTLNLEDVKMDEYWRRPQEPENQNGEEKAAASLISKCKRRRQRRDFQKDVLPGLVSLSRNEVNEDLQIIGGMMKASGRSSPTRWMRHNGRNGLHSQARGKLRPRNLALTLTEIQVNPPQPPHTPAESELDGRTMIGWGRTTRRCRRQRCTPATIASPLNLKV